MEYVCPDNNTMYVKKIHEYLTASIQRTLTEMTSIVKSEV